jgi:hypothetical protein
MAHPHHHAVSSTKLFGGDVRDYVALHDWFDQSKAHVADARHRQLLHTSFGVFLAQQQFGHTLRLSNGRDMPVRTVAEQHVREDTGFIPSAQQAYASLALAPWMSAGLDADHALGHARADAADLGGVPGDYVRAHEYLEQSRGHLEPERHRVMLHHAFGIDLAVQALGPELCLTGGGSVPLRLVLERHLVRDVGRVMTVEEAFDSMALLPWMSRGAAALSRKLGRLVPDEGAGESACAR